MLPLTTLEEYCEKPGEDANLLGLLIDVGELPRRCLRRLFRWIYVDVDEMMVSPHVRQDMNPLSKAVSE
jgi:hypothetical protein